MLSVWEERKVRLYGEHANVHQSYSQNDSGDLRGVARGDGEFGCLCGKAGTSHLCDGSAHSSGCVVNGSNAVAAFCAINPRWACVRVTVAILCVYLSVFLLPLYSIRLHLQAMTRYRFLVFHFDSRVQELWR